MHGSGTPLSMCLPTTEVTESRWAYERLAGQCGGEVLQIRWLLFRTLLFCLPMRGVNFFSCISFWRVGVGLKSDMNQQIEASGLCYGRLDQFQIKQTVWGPNLNFVVFAPARPIPHSPIQHSTNGISGISQTDACRPKLEIMTWIRTYHPIETCLFASWFEIGPSVP